MSNIFDVFRRNNVVEMDDIREEKQIGAGLMSGIKHSNREIDDFGPLSKSNRIVTLRASSASPVFPFTETSAAAAEQYRIIRTKLLHNPKKLQLILISSPCSGDGKTITAINIAGSLALKTDSRTLLIDGDLRRPRVAEELDIPQSPGLTDVLAGKVALDDALVRAEQFPNLFILTAGTPANNPAELLDSPRWLVLLEQVRNRCANVIFDGPPAGSVADYELLQHACDGVILVIRPDHSDRAACFKAFEIVAKPKLTGVVLNCTEDWWLWKTPGYAYYRAYSEPNR